MNVDLIIKEPFFSDEDREDFVKFKTVIGNKLETVSTDFMSKKISFNDAIDRIHSLDFPCVSKYTVDLFFVLECAAILETHYQKAGIDNEIFKGFIKDIKCKVDECRYVKKVFGTFVVEWFNGFFGLTRFALGRLEYDAAKCDQDATTMFGFELKDGDFLLACHIPSSGPLKQELCIDSLKMAYNFFKDRLNNGIMPVVCSSWLFYPEYKEVFGVGTNTENFIRNFKMTSVKKHDKFEDAWRIFGMDICEDLSQLPCETSLQRKFIEYIKAGKTFGSARGILLFDGENILTRE